MTAWHPALLGYWYAVACAKEIGRKPVAVSLLGVHIALARTEAGSWIALEDRCPHRHAPLSAGCIQGDRIACPYHGWTFDADGNLKAVPGLPSGGTSPNIRVRSFAVRELDGFVWLRPAETGAPEPSALVRETDTATRRFQWRTRWHAHVIDAMENFLDPMHTHFVHAGLVRRDTARVPAEARFHSTAEGFIVDYDSRSPQSGLLYRLFESRRTVERAHFAIPGSARLEYAYANGSRVLIDLHFTPAGADETDVFVALHVAGRWAPAWAVRMLAWPLLKRVNAQDAAILRMQAENRRRFDSRRGVSTRLDIVRGALEKFWILGEPPAPSGERVFNVGMML